jgi:hypothetical protein
LLEQFSSRQEVCALVAFETPEGYTSIQPFYG